MLSETVIVRDLVVIGTKGMLSKYHLLYILIHSFLFPNIKK